MPLECRVFLIGGTSHTGKSTVAQTLASQLGWSCRSTDSLARHPGRPWKPEAQQVPPHVTEHDLSLSVDELIADVVRHYRDNVWPLVLEMVTARATDPSADPLVLEGSALLPELAAALTLDNVRAVWLTAGDALLERRINASSRYETQSPPERTLIDRSLARTRAYNARMMDAVKRHGLTWLEVDDTSRVEELVDLCRALLEGPVSSLEVRRIEPTDAGMADLLRQSTEHASSLYPAESNHLDGVAELSQEHVHLVGVYARGRLVGMGAVKRLVHDVEYGEIKRLFVLPAFRGNGLARVLMDELESHLRERGIRVSRLETGIYQPEAIGLYESLGYRVRGPFGAYRPDPLSVFMEKRIPAR